MDFIVTVLLTVIMFGILILVHEFGHFITAKLFKVKVNEFSLEQVQDEKLLITKFKSDDLVFHLGRRAKGFIEKRFISQKNDT
jgi:hypothetical protein